MNSQLSPQTIARLQKTVPLLAALLLAVLLGVQLAKLIWLLVPAPEQGLWAPRPAEPAQASAAQRPSSTINVAAIQQAKLFGEFRPEAAIAQAQSTEDAPDTNLRLKLRGILAMQDAADSRALIEQTRGELKAYAVGMAIPGGAELHSIYVDRVLLERGGRLETLRLEKDEVVDTSPRNTASATSSRALGGSAPRILDAATSAKLSTIRNELLNDPTKASQYLRVQPARSNGAMRGYRIYPGRNRELFQQAGLRPGDIVTSVNGVSLDDPSKSFQLLGDLSSAQQLNLQIERGGQLQSVSVNLN
ncbi:general secretion pathway protein C [Oceanococcus atlanticus]|uniref:General secretion pathway protein C n=1 Tax=Oceanococcus atlanticus TaxID=1317117 RepID=A0A1Y1SFJ0_9GAMM|nr:type II secretion system protein GspC [Oceanococcus atlanticus]ORE88434.1 general secretion pathway protein C [Oceanococcus atlanticus]